MHSFYGTSQLHEAPLIQEDKQHGVAGHDREEVEENGDHHSSAGSIPSSDVLVQLHNTTKQHTLILIIFTHKQS